MADTTCSVDECERDVWSRGWCSTHYQRWRLYGGVNASKPIKQPKTPRPCRLPGCPRVEASITRGMCRSCYGRWLTDGKPTVPRPPVYLSPDLSAEEKFWSNVEKTDYCWLWTGANNRGYGFFTARCVRMLAHRFSWELHNGPIPDGLLVRHKVCDNPPCVNPAHLAIGTEADNKRDMVEHQRSARGERHHSATLTEDLVREIRARKANGEKYADICRALGIG